MHMERQQLLELEPSVPWELLHFLVEILKLPIGELLSFHRWMARLSKRQLLLLISILRLEPAAVLEIKTRLDAASANYLPSSVPSFPSASSYSPLSASSSMGSFASESVPSKMNAIGFSTESLMCVICVIVLYLS